MILNKVDSWLLTFSNCDVALKSADEDLLVCLSIAYIIYVNKTFTGLKAGIKRYLGNL